MKKKKKKRRRRKKKKKKKRKRRKRKKKRRGGGGSGSGSKVSHLANMHSILGCWNITLWQKFYGCCIHFAAFFRHLVTDCFFSRTTTITHNNCSGGPPFRWNICPQSIEAKAVCGWTLLSCTGNLWY